MQEMTACIIAAQFSWFFFVIMTLNLFAKNDIIKQKYCKPTLKNGLTILWHNTNPAANIEYSAFSILNPFTKVKICSTTVDHDFRSKWLQVFDQSQDQLLCQCADICVGE